MHTTNGVLFIKLFSFFPFLFSFFTTGTSFTSTLVAGAFTTFSTFFGLRFKSFATICINCSISDASSGIIYIRYIGMSRDIGLLFLDKICPRSGVFI